MDKIWDRKSFEVWGHWPLWRGWKHRMTTQNRQKSNAKKKLQNYVHKVTILKHLDTDMLLKISAIQSAQCLHYSTHAIYVIRTSYFQTLYKSNVHCILIYQVVLYMGISLNGWTPNFANQPNYYLRSSWVPDDTSAIVVLVIYLRQIVTLYTIIVIMCLIADITSLFTQPVLNLTFTTRGTYVNM